MGATFIQGYIVFFKVDLLDNFFKKGTSYLRADLQIKISQASQNLLSKILSDNYKYAIIDNEFGKFFCKFITPLRGYFGDT